MMNTENKEIEKVSITGMSLNTLSQIIFSDNKKKGFYEEGMEMMDFLLAKGADWEMIKYFEKLKFSQRVALIHTEISEALEGDRKDLMDDHLPHLKSKDVELADALIRILDAAAAYDIDIESAVEQKLNYNRTRPYRHGKKY